MADTRRFNTGHVMAAVRAANALELPEDAAVNLRLDWQRGIKVYIHLYGDKEELRAVRRVIGPCRKEPAGTGGGRDGRMVLKAESLPDVDEGARVQADVTIFPGGASCERVQIGTEVRPVTKVVETGETEEVPVFEWECEEVLVDG